jgi:hypothetical protein
LTKETISRVVWITNVAGGICADGSSGGRVAHQRPGVADRSDITHTLNLQRRSLIDRALLDPTDATKMAHANTALAKSFEQMSATAETARAPLEGLKKLELDSASLRGQLDTTAATSSLNSLTTSLADITTGSKTAGAPFQNLGQTVVRSLEEMLIKMMIVAPLAKALQGALGGFLPTGTGGGGPASHSPGSPAASTAAARRRSRASFASWPPGPSTWRRPSTAALGPASSRRSCGATRAC